MIASAAAHYFVHKLYTIYGKKRGSFSLFMGARRQFEEMPNKKVKSGELRNKNLAITARAQVKRRETSKDYCYSEIETVMFLQKVRIRTY